MTDGTPEETSQAQAYTVRLELVDEPGALLDALRPIADHGGNLLSILHERGNVTPRGRIPVEIDLEIHPERFDDLVEALRTAGVNVVEAGEERYSEELTVLLSGPLVATDLSDTISELEAESNVAVTDISLSAPEGADATASARFRLATDRGDPESTLAHVRALADRKGLTVVEPQIDHGGEA